MWYKLVQGLHARLRRRRRLSGRRASPPFVSERAKFLRLSSPIFSGKRYIGAGKEHGLGNRCHWQRVGAWWRNCLAERLALWLVGDPPRRGRHQEMGGIPAGDDSHRCRMLPHGEA